MAAPPGASAGMHKLTNVEAQRIMAILEESCAKLDLLSHVPPMELPDEDQLRDELGPDVLQVRALHLPVTVREDRLYDPGLTLPPSLARTCCR